MKRLILSLLIALGCCVSALAVPAYPGLISYTQPDGSVIRIRMHGDEFFHWTTNEKGEVVELDADGYYRVVDAATLAPRKAAARIKRAAVESEYRGPAQAAAAIGEKHFLVILVEFSDVRFQYGKQAFEDLMNGNGQNYANVSARDYYKQNSGDKFQPIFDVYGPVTLSGTQEYYGQNDSDGNDLRAREAVWEACQALDDQITFSNYDADGDKEVDLVFMYYAGRGEADGGGKNCIWPHQWSIDGIDYGTDLYNNHRLDDRKISKYACTNELSKVSNDLVLNGIGTACHEFGHALGLPDLYDTDYKENGQCGGLYGYSLMASGSYNNGGHTPPYLNIEERIILGWVNENAITEITGAGDYTLTSVKNNVAYKTATDLNGEYFLYECRDGLGWDAAIPEPGLIVYHVDKSQRQITIHNRNNNYVEVTSTAQELWNWTMYNAINENGSHPCFYVVPAGNPSSLNFTSSYLYAFPGDSNAVTFTGTSWNGMESLVTLTDIKFINSTVSFTVPAAALHNWAIATGNGPYTSGNSFPLSLEGNGEPYSDIEWFFDDEPVTASSVTLSAGTHVVEAHMTMVSGGTKIVELTLEAQ